MDPGKSYALSTQASVRREPFGGLVYRYDNRRLYFVHSKPMVEFLESLDAIASPDRSIEQTIDAFLDERQLPSANKASFLTALGKLETLEVLREL